VAFRDGPFENLKVPLVWTAAAVVVVAIVGAILLLLNDRREAAGEGGPNGVRAGFETAVGPVGGVLAAPVRWVGSASDYIGGYFFAVSENRRLKRELAELQPWRDQAIALKNVNARYEAMLGIRTEPPVAMVTARSVSESRGPFANARLIDVGARKGVKVGNPVINEHGLIGRVTGVSPGVSRVLLLTDVASQTPVLIDRSDARAILKGDGSGNPRLEFVRGEDAVRSGDRILSSGDGGGFPRGIPVGIAAKGIDGSWRVKLFSDRGAIDFVRVMLFQDFGQLVEAEDLNAAPLAALPPGAPPPVEQAASATTAAPRPRTPAPAPAPASPGPAATPPRPEPADTPAPAAPAAGGGGAR
jgi:rod shape-determining protein MreC